MLSVLDSVKREVRLLYSQSGELLFHGQAHIEFVAKHTSLFAADLEANSTIATMAAWMHDLNYFVAKDSPPELGANLRSELLGKCGAPGIAVQLERIILESHTAYRGASISREAMALSDADTLFKSLPITPIIFARRYILQTGVSLVQLAEKIVSEQEPLFEQEIYFYSNTARKAYMSWARTNLNLWANVLEWSRSPLFDERLIHFDR